VDRGADGEVSQFLARGTTYRSWNFPGESGRSPQTP